MTITPRVTRRGSRLDWVKFDFDLSRDGSVDPTDKALYAAIASFVDLETRESPETVSVDLNAIPSDVPTRKRLAACIGRSVDTVDRATKRLEDRGLLRVHRQPDPNNPKVMLPSEYELLDHELWDQRAAERAAARAARRQGAGVSAGQGGGRMGAATPGRAVAATPGRTDAAVKDEREVEEEKGGEKTPDGRQASTGSRGSSAGGSAASGKSKPPSYTSDQRHRYNTFVSALPAPLKALVPNGLPKPLVDAVLAATDHDSSEGRTVEQLVEFRLLPKWDKHYSRRDQAGPIRKPVGVLTEMLHRTAECLDPRCDERTNVDTGLPCISCEQRLADKRAERAVEQAAKAAEAPSRCPESHVVPPARKMLPKRPERPVPPPREVAITEVSDQQRALARAAVLASRGKNRVSRIP